ncbi:MAG: Cbp1 family collagen-binding glycoprotein adhesin [Candidatus Krumholzibacteriia bacterium]
MRKPVLFVSLALVVVLLAVAGVLYQKLQQRSNEYTTLQADEKAVRDRYGEAINEIAAIQDSLNTIMLGEEGAQAMATQLEAEKNLSRDRGDEVVARIAVIKSGIERAKARIKDLESQLQKSGVKVAGLEKMIRGLRATVVERETTIAQLTQRVNELQTQVVGLSTEVQQGKETIQGQVATIETQNVSLEKKRRELATVYYTIGSKKELISDGVIVATGGLLGLGKTLKPSGQIDETRFLALDTDQENLIVIPAAKARVLSAQPPASYELQKAGDQVELHILDPQAFRAIKRVIIMTG